MIIVHCFSVSNRSRSVSLTVRCFHIRKQCGFEKIPEYCSRRHLDFSNSSTALNPELIEWRLVFHQIFPLDVFPEPKPQLFLRWSQSFLWQMTESDCAVTPHRWKEQERLLRPSSLWEFTPSTVSVAANFRERLIRSAFEILSLVWIHVSFWYVILHLFTVE